MNLLKCCLLLFFCSNVALAGNPLVTNIFTADPSGRVFNGQLYVYTSHDLADCPSLCESYGAPVADPTGFRKGGVTALGWLAGSGDVLPERNISADDSARQGAGKKDSR